MKLTLRTIFRYRFAVVAGIFVLVLIVKKFHILSYVEAAALCFGLSGFYLMVKFASFYVMRDRFARHGYTLDGQPLAFRLLCWAWEIGRGNGSIKDRLTDEGESPFTRPVDFVRGAVYLFLAYAFLFMKFIFQPPYV